MHVHVNFFPGASLAKVVFVTEEDFEVAQIQVILVTSFGKREKLCEQISLLMHHS